MYILVPDLDLQMLEVSGLTPSLSDLYLMNLLVTTAMFLVLTFRAWIELKNYNIMWKEIRRRSTNEVVSRILKAERELFTKVEGGTELYDLLCRMFDVEAK